MNLRELRNPADVEAMDGRIVAGVYQIPVMNGRDRPAVLESCNPNLDFQ